MWRNRGVRALGSCLSSASSSMCFVPSVSPTANPHCTVLLRAQTPRALTLQPQNTTLANPSLLQFLHMPPRAYNVILCFYGFQERSSQLESLHQCPSTWLSGARQYSPTGLMLMCWYFPSGVLLVPSSALPFCKSPIFNYSSFLLKGTVVIIQNSLCLSFCLWQGRQRRKLLWSGTSFLVS